MNLAGNSARRGVVAVYVSRHLNAQRLRMISSNQHTPVASPSSASPHMAATRSLLLVDDEATLRSALRRYFTRRGWRVFEAEDGEQARAMLLDGELAGGGFDAIITDIRMPRLSGMALHDIVAQTDPSVSHRFVFSSGDTGDDDAIAFLARTDCPVVSKPFELSSLLAIVERVATRAASPSTS